MTTWTPQELGLLATADELEITTARLDGSLRGWVSIWVVCVGNGLYARSWRGTGGAWYRNAAHQRRARIRVGELERDVTADRLDDADADAAIQAVIDDVYRTKYARYGDTYVQSMTAEQARATTLQLVPHD